VVTEIPSTAERIAAAAIRHEGTVRSVPPPGRHHHVIKMMAALGFTARDVHDQGFTTDRGRFVDRKEGFLIAKAAGQILRKTGPADKLFSEDLW